MELRVAFPLLAIWWFILSNQAAAQIGEPPVVPPDVVLGKDGGSVRIDSEGLKKALQSLGYKPTQVKSGDSIAWQIMETHADGTERKHLFGFDPKADTVFIIAGGFSFAPDPKRASNAWFRKLLKHNHQLAPSYIFLNDFDVFGLTTVIGNVNVTPDRLKSKLKEHISNFDERLVPLVKELPPMAKEEEEP